MIESRTNLRAADIIRILTEAAERAGQSLEDYQVCIEANGKNNDYDSLEQVRVRTGRNGVTLQLLEEDVDWKNKYKYIISSEYGGDENPCFLW